MDQRKEEEEKEEGSVLKEPTDRQREEEEGSGVLKEATDHQREEEEGSGVLKEATDQQREEASSEEPAGRHSEEPTDQRKEAEAEAVTERSSDEESEAASTLFVHPCSLLRYLVRAFACCLGMPDSFGGGTEKRSDAAPASVDSSRDVDVADRSTGAATGFYMQEVITRVFVVRRPRPPSGNPREGSGGNGGHHH